MSENIEVEKGEAFLVLIKSTFKQNYSLGDSLVSMVVVGRTGGDYYEAQLRFSGIES
jgi:hypothetical protein